MAAPTATAISAAVLLCAAAFLATGGAAKASAADVVADACANVTNRYHQYRGPGLTRDSCEIALWSDKRSASAKHPRDLALVAMALVQEGAAVAGAKVAGALSSGDAAKLSKDTKLNLRYCRLDYEAVAHTVAVCREMVQEYNPGVQGHDGDGNMIPYNYLECANRLMNAASGCWAHISHDYETKKAVWKEVNEVASRANLAKAMVEKMLGVVDGYATDHFIDDDDDDDDDEISDDHRSGGGADDDDDDDD
ncbi:hypothetical protein SETIT_5G298700v2 [Setaria italica]|uniref:Pectinesterase inhibitor domain-containing protein n=2 Tax=Setaria TaxID=4554 RepID=K3XL99_SETIT|nr:hypothetical protein SETIT_5G298700v2 [Setaria italica]